MSSDFDAELEALAENASKISLMGRLGYIIMCIEEYVTHVYPDRDWTILAKALWHFSSTTISDWMGLIMHLVPDYALKKEKYNDDVRFVLTLDEFHSLLQLYRDITDFDTFNTILHIPDSLICEYDDAISDGNLSHTAYVGKVAVTKIKDIAKILNENHIALPDIHRLDFLTLKDTALNNMWGPHFEGIKLSIILNPPTS